MFRVLRFDFGRLKGFKDYDKFDKAIMYAKTQSSRGKLCSIRNSNDNIIMVFENGKLTADYRKHYE